MRGLVIREPYITDIFEGRKTWELRSRNANIRGRIALIKKGSGLILGTVHLVDVVPLAEKEIKRRKEHGEPAGNFGNSNKVVYAWVLQKAKRFKKPISYKHPNGAIIWVRLRARTPSAIGAALKPKPH